MNTKEKILAPSRELVMQLQADIRDDQRLITATQEALVTLRAQGDPHVAGVEAKLAEEDIRSIDGVKSVKNDVHIAQTNTSTPR